ncbi:site-specific integrase [Natronococcus occultus]|uniref:site-specific integrase n=1 Tax=Natronococcus occultus TaxID=29288 RepID=UPI001C27A02F|nr:site-specific integrase [Natronococcus occultus]
MDSPGFEPGASPQACYRRFSVEAMTTLEPMHPTEAVQTYLDGRTDLSPSSKENHEYRLERFLEWCEEEGIDDMNDLTGRNLHQHKIWRSQDVNNVTLKNQLGTVRQS